MNGNIKEQGQYKKELQKMNDHRLAIHLLDMEERRYNDAINELKKAHMEGHKWSQYVNKFWEAAHRSCASCWKTTSTSHKDLLNKGNRTVWEVWSRRDQTCRLRPRTCYLSAPYHNGTINVRMVRRRKYGLSPSAPVVGLQQPGNVGLTYESISYNCLATIL